ncbi:S8 family serine peptidase [Flavimarina sp. Hel_I_48]|uniref:S8 family serine peptidase n=1 Tax=Flavimarina sp. Hel_I_48 TaxID=1392488 RepID=UPI0004DEEA37|nr:S8 family serine peptidase [Flavimarina sp. Hel_I_48]
MKIILILLFISFSVHAQQEDALVYLVDKENVEEFINQPNTILSQRSIDRKGRHSTPIDSRDVPVNEEFITILKNKEHVQVLAKSKWMNSVYIRGDLTEIEKLKDLYFVASIEFLNKTLNQPNLEKDELPKNSVVYNVRDYNYGSALNQTQMISLESLHDRGLNGDGMHIAIMDSGFPNITENPAYSSLISEGRLLGTYDFVDRSRNVQGFGTHGSQTLSVMAGLKENEFIGTAPQASYYLFRTEFTPSENPVEEAWWVEALERADSLGIDVVNTSLGYRDFDESKYNYGYEDLDGNTTISARGANIGFEKGMLIVTSAGNDGQATFNTVATPADSPGVLSIGAVDSLGEYAAFSSMGPTVDGRIKPDVMAQGKSTAILDTNGNLDFVNGTSFSSPIIAGAAACLWEGLPSLKNSQIMDLIRESGSQYLNPSNEMGYGIPNFESTYQKGLLLKLNNDFFQDRFGIAENPVASEVVFSIPHGILHADIQFFDVLGKKILQTKITNSANRVNVSQFDSGIYIALITSGRISNSFKIIKR